MPLLTAAVRGDLRAAMEAEVRDAAPATPQGICCEAKPALLAELPCCPAPAAAASGRQPGA